MYDHLELTLMDKAALQVLLAPAIIGVVEILKPFLPPGFGGVVAVVLGGIGGAALGFTHGDPPEMLIADGLEGVAIGAAAAGIYKVSQNVGPPNE